MSKKILIQILKFSMAAGLLVWLYRSGKLNFSYISQLMDYPISLIAALLLSGINLWAVTIRLKYILQSRAVLPLPVKGLFAVNWIGNFFSSVLPGSVSGDLVKVIYIKRMDQTLSTAFLLVSIFIDRLMGLAGLILLLGLCSLLNYSTIVASSPKILPLLQFNFFLFGATITVLLIFFFKSKWISSLLMVSELYLPFKSISRRVRDFWNDLCRVKVYVAKGVLLSVVVHITSVTFFYTLSLPFFKTHFTLIQAMTIVPIGFISTAIPIAPGGLGVGHAVFQELFALVGENDGANLFNLYFIVNLCFNLIGILPYLWIGYRKKQNVLHS